MNTEAEIYGIVRMTYLILRILIKEERIFYILCYIN